MKEIQRLRKQARKSVFWKYFHHSQYTTVLNQFSEDASFIYPPENILELNACILKCFPWLFCRWLSRNGDQRVPSIGGFTSSTSSVPERKTTLDYYKTIHRPITQYETVQKLLQQSEEATKAVGQKYTINTFHLGVCMKGVVSLQMLSRMSQKQNFIFS